MGSSLRRTRTEQAMHWKTGHQVTLAAFLPSLHPNMISFPTQKLILTWLKPCIPLASVWPHLKSQLHWLVHSWAGWEHSCGTDFFLCGSRRHFFQDLGWLMHSDTLGFSAPTRLNGRKPKHLPRASIPWHIQCGHLQFRNWEGFLWWSGTVLCISKSRKKHYKKKYLLTCIQYFNKEAFLWLKIFLSKTCLPQGRIILGQVLNMSGLKRPPLPSHLWIFENMQSLSAQGRPPTSETLRMGPGNLHCESTLSVALWHRILKSTFLNY